MPLAVLECNLFLCHKKEVLKKEKYSYSSSCWWGTINKF
jgi:hypothetical protein